jgi:sigma-B regulation protein RsbU (phosphoserine phosphatase)
MTDGVAATSPIESAASRLQCLEVRGGNRRVSHAVEVPGLMGWIHSDPAEAAGQGGDVHYFSVCSKGILSRFALADVSGHGDSSSRIAELLRQLILKYIDTWDQSELMRELNEEFKSRIEAQEYATAVLFAYFQPTRELVFTNAGHPPALWYHAANATWHWLEPATAFARLIEGLPLGLISGTDYVQVAVRLDWNDVIILYTDGITDATNAAGEMLGADGLLALVRNLPLESPALMAGHLAAAVQNFRGTRTREDDQSFFILRQLEA